MWSLDTQTVWIIAGMALITYGIRVSGLLLAGFIPRKGPWARAMNSLTSAVLMALVAPELVANGWLGAVGGGVVVAVMLTLRNAFVAMVLAVLVVAGGRWLLGG